MILRPAKTSDASGIAAVHVAGWQAAYRHLLPGAYLDALDPAEREVRWSMRLPRGVLIAEVDGQVAGFASTGRCRDKDLPDSTELYALYLAPDRWRHGLGSALLEAVVVPGLVLWTLAGNGGARAFYERRGFRTDGAAKTISPGGHVLVELRYQLGEVPGYGARARRQDVHS